MVNTEENMQTLGLLFTDNIHKDILQIILSHLERNELKTLRETCVYLKNSIQPQFSLSSFIVEFYNLATELKKLNATKPWDSHLRTNSYATENLKEAKNQFMAIVCVLLLVIIASSWIAINIIETRKESRKTSKEHLIVANLIMFNITAVFFCMTYGLYKCLNRWQVQYDLENIKVRKKILAKHDNKLSSIHTKLKRITNLIEKKMLEAIYQLLYSITSFSDSLLFIRQASEQKILPANYIQWFSLGLTVYELKYYPAEKQWDLVAHTNNNVTDYRIKQQITTEKKMLGYKLKRLLEGKELVEVKNDSEKFFKAIIEREDPDHLMQQILRYNSSLRTITQHDFFAIVPNPAKILVVPKIINSITEIEVPDEFEKSLNENLPIYILMKKWPDTRLKKITKINHNNEYTYQEVGLSIPLRFILKNKEKYPKNEWHRLLSNIISTYETSFEDYENFKQAHESLLGNSILQLNSDGECYFQSASPSPSDSSCWARIFRQQSAGAQESQELNERTRLLPSNSANLIQ